MYATNEWDTLRQVIVGRAIGARVPDLDLSMRLVNYADVEDATTIHTGAYPDIVTQEADEDLETFVRFLRNEHVEVLRPFDSDQVVKYYDYCPRDIVFLHGEHAIATPMPIRARACNYHPLAHHFPTITEAPRYYADDLYNTKCLGDPDTLALTEVAPSFDAANCIRANDDILYLVSNSGNRAGADWLQKHTGLNIHPLEGVYSYMHIDSTVAFLREGLMLLNPTRIKDVNQLPEPFRHWDYIMCPEPTDIGYYGDYNNASVWINMNMLSISPTLVALEENQHSLRIELEKHGIDCAMLPTRHQRTLGGGFHCVTLDTIRSAS
jgi:scyllo-inosamine-4-phosphate amidinotransferase 1